MKKHPKTFGLSVFSWLDEEFVKITFPEEDVTYLDEMKRLLKGEMDD